MSGGCTSALASEVRPIIDNNDNLRELSINAQVPTPSPGRRVKIRCEKSMHRDEKRSSQQRRSSREGRY